MSLVRPQPHHVVGVGLAPGCLLCPGERTWSAVGDISANGRNSDAVTLLLRTRLHAQVKEKHHRDTKLTNLALKSLFGAMIDMTLNPSGDALI